MDVVLFKDTWELAELELTHESARDNMPARRTPILLWALLSNRVFVDDYVYKHFLFSLMDFSFFVMSLIYISFFYLFFWEFNNFGVLYKFFYYSLDFSLVFVKVFVDDFFLSRFFSTIAFSRIMSGRYLFANAVKVSNYCLFFIMRDVFFKLFMVNNLFLLYFFFSSNTFLKKKLNRILLKFFFLKFRSFLILDAFPFFVHDVSVARMPINYKFLIS